MSGILGLISWDLNPAPHAFDKSFSSLLRRGRFSNGLHSPHSHLAVVHNDPSKAQPYAESSTGLTIVFEGRLDNRSELSKELDLTAGSPDFLLALKAFQKWSLDAPEKLLGDFAFAIWNEKRKELFLARDYIGVKPLYYAAFQNRAGFCSEAAPLLDMFHLERTPNPALLNALLVGDLQDPEASFFKNIHQLPPGHCLLLGGEGQRRLHRYWNPAIKLGTSQKAKDYEEEFRRLFVESVKARLASSGTAGILWSGGLDSTQIAAAAMALKKENSALPALHAVTWTANGMLKADIDSVQHLKNLYGLETDLITPPGNAAKTNLEYFSEAGETPHLDCFAGLSFLLEPLATKGCQTVFAGTGANEIGVYPETGQLHDLLLGGRFISFSKEMPRVANALDIPVSEAYHWILSETVRELLPVTVRSLWKRSYYKKLDWLKPELLHCLPQTSLPRKRKFKTFAQEMLYRELTHPWFALSLNQLDYGAASYGMEFVHPFLDRRLVEFCLKIPGSVRVENGYRKMFVQRALQPLVQMPLRVQDCSDCYIPDQENERSAEFQQKRLKFYLSNPDAFIYTYVDYAIIQTWMEPGRADFWSHHALLWRLVRLETWFQKFFSSKTLEHREKTNERIRSPLPRPKTLQP